MQDGDPADTYIINRLILENNIMNQAIDAPGQI
jgi:hypothetical protein